MKSPILFALTALASALVACAQAEMLSHSYSGQRRDGTPPPTEPMLMLDAHLRLFTDTFEYLADTGGLAVRTATTKAR